MPKAIPAQTKTNSIINPGIHNQGNSQLPRGSDGACDPHHELNADSTTANQCSTHYTPGHHDAWHHAPNSPPGKMPPLWPLESSSPSPSPPASPASTSSSTAVGDSKEWPAASKDEITEMESSAVLGSIQESEGVQKDKYERDNSLLGVRSS